MNIQVNAIDYWVGCNTRQMAHRFYDVARVVYCICESSDTRYSRMNGAASFQFVESTMITVTNRLITKVLEGIGPGRGERR